MEAFLANLAGQYTWAMTLFVVMGVFRVVFKPLLALAHAVVDATPSDSDNKALAAAEGSSIGKALLWLCDYLFSIKLPGQK